MKAFTQIEIERKFVVDYIPEGLLEPRQYKLIRQGYLIYDAEREVRIRDKAGIYTMTVKQGSGLKREETEIELDQTQFETLWPLTQGKRVEKRRYKIPYISHTLELDIFTGELDSLVLVEVEFASEEASRGFQPPEFIKQEVTTDPEYKNANLASNGIPAH